MLRVGVWEKMDELGYFCKRLHANEYAFLANWIAIMPLPYRWLIFAFIFCIGLL